MLKLFEPTKIGRVGLRNRIVFPATATHYANQDGTVSQRLIRSALGKSGSIATRLGIRFRRGHFCGTRDMIYHEP